MKLCWEATGGAPGSCVRGSLTVQEFVYLASEVKIKKLFR